MMERQTAKKVRLWDIMNGEFVKKEGFEPSYVKTHGGENVARAHVTGTVVSVFKSEDGNFVSVTIDDGSDTMRLKAFNETEVLDNLEEGNIVDVVGKVREYNGENYLIAEITRKVEDPNFELMRRLELLRKEKSLKAKGKFDVEGGETKGKGAPGPGESGNAEEGKETEGREKTGKDPQEPPGEKANLKKEVLEFIETQNDGVVYSEICEKVEAKEAELEGVIDELLSEGICYEPSPGKIKKI